MSKITVGWLEHDVGIIGGAEMSTNALLSNPPENVEIVPCPANKRPNTEEIDVFVIQNSVTYKAQWIEELAMKPVVKQIRDPWYAGSPILRRWLLDNATLIFSSWVQQEKFDYFVDWDNVDTNTIPVPIDLRDFRKAGKNSQERNGTLFVGRTDTFKGIHTVIDWALKNKEPLTLAGDEKYAKGMMDISELPGYIKFIGKVDYANMPELMASHEKYIALPMWPEAFGRSVVEAWAAGCELVLNNNVGSKDWIEEYSSWLGYDKPIKTFWNIVTGVVENG